MVVVVVSGAGGGGGVESVNVVGPFESDVEVFVWGAAAAVGGGGGVGVLDGGYNGHGCEVLHKDDWCSGGESHGMFKGGGKHHAAWRGDPDVCASPSAGYLGRGDCSGSNGELGEEGRVLFEKRLGGCDDFAIEEHTAEITRYAAAVAATVLFEPVVVFGVFEIGAFFDGGMRFGVCNQGLGEGVIVGDSVGCSVSLGTGIIAFWRRRRRRR